MTLARLRGTPVEAAAHYLGGIGAFRSEPFAVSQFVLLSSKPRVGGGPYVIEADFPLRGAYYEGVDGDMLDDMVEEGR